MGGIESVKEENKKEEEMKLKFKVHLLNIKFCERRYNLMSPKGELFSQPSR